MKAKQTNQREQDAIDLREDLKDFKETKKSIKALIKVKKDKKATGKDQVADSEDFKLIEKKAKTAIDKLFKAKSA